MCSVIFVKYVLNLRSSKSGSVVRFRINEEEYQLRLPLSNQMSCILSLADARHPIASKEERREMVSSFCNTYLSGKLKINSWTPGLVANMATGVKIPREELVQGKKE